MPDALRLGRYRLLERLASGGMAELFLALAEGEAGFARTCVVKRILPHLEEDPAFVQMFLDEARLAARLHHPSIVQIFELGRSGEDYFFAMEYLPGENWSAIARETVRRNEPIPLGVAVRMARAAADALHHAHEARDEAGNSLKVIHRDVSPSNLILTYQGLVKVVDFGIARATTMTTRTETGRIKGKTSYMAPEQAMGHPVDRRVDVWALGVCLHELLTGQPLFRGVTTAEVALKVTQGEIASLIQMRPDVPASLNDLVMQTLQRDPEARTPTAAVLRDALDSVLATDLRPSASTELEPYLERLFGRERMEKRLRPLTLPDSLARASHPTTELGVMTVTQLEAPRRETVAMPGPPRMSSRRRWWVPAASVALLLAAGGVWRLWPVAPVPVLPPPRETAPVPPLVAVQPSPPPTVPSPPPTIAPVVRVATPRRRVARPASTGELTLVTQPYAEVAWNGTHLGTTPLFGVSMPTGKHALRLRDPDGKDHRLEVTVGQGAVTTMRVRLERLPFWPAGAGSRESN